MFWAQWIVQNYMFTKVKIYSTHQKKRPFRCVFWSVNHIGCVVLTASMEMCQHPCTFIPPCGSVEALSAKHHLLFLMWKVRRCCGEMHLHLQTFWIGFFQDLSADSGNQGSDGSFAWRCISGKVCDARARFFTWYKDIDGWDVLIWLNQIELDVNINGLRLYLAGSSNLTFHFARWTASRCK